jgi:hypothetical protein
VGEVRVRVREALGLLVMAGTAGCAISVPPPRTPAEGPAAAHEAWARVLAARVDATGRIDFAGIAQEPRDLDLFVSWLAGTSPRSAPGAFSGQDAVLAYYLNAYNALAMYNVIRSGIPPELGSIKVRFFYRDRLLLGGEKISLYRLENAVIRPMGEPRVHFALNCMVRGCPRLPQVPFDADRLDAQLDRAARLFFSEPRNVELDTARRVVRFNEILRFYTKDFLEKAPSLVAYANRYRSEPIPADWKVEFIPYDWTLNRQ